MSDLQNGVGPEAPTTPDPTPSGSEESSPPKRAGRWLFAELVVVISGVFIALWLEGWTDEREDRKQEVIVLQSLHREFEANREELESQFSIYERRLGAATEFLELGSAAAQLPPDSARVLWNWFLRGGTFDPVTGTLDGLLATGRLDLIQNAELRARLAGWSSRLANMRLVEERIGNLVAEQIYPWLRQQSALPPGGFGSTGSALGRFAFDAERIHSSFVFENFVRELLGWEGALRADRAEVDQVIDDVLAAIDSELD